ncbi:UTP--glucose-1-phosphate uridylyltransferase [Myxococcota bacterium]|nr:UTP--glucose-1-phosphate uridylyltransferase [Myxococcota bacterium]MBU1379949.1 UTP--glucose-1-phosphate uridylyltransferase [Myxococcota bacterium]MBU1497075.1 UTP--glucose-1-phosphate uridylyltransferase [Myxococcota bacterium]
MRNSTVTCAVIPAAGLGTRLLPATKAIPKELLPVVDIPAIQYITQEIVDSGINKIIFITAKGKEAIIDHFDSAPELEAHLESRSNFKMLDAVRHAGKMASFVAVRQDRPLGLGHAIGRSSSVVDGDAFAVVLPDDLIDSEVPALAQLLAVYEKNTPDAVFALMEVDPSQTHKYGIIAGEMKEEGIWEVTDMVEKPRDGTAPSCMAVIGRYILSKKIFEYIESTRSGSGGEVQLTDALKLILKNGGRILGVTFEGKRFDTGDVSGYIQANLNYALKRPELGADLRRKISDILK